MLENKQNTPILLNGRGPFDSNLIMCRSCACAAYMLTNCEEMIGLVMAHDKKMLPNGTLALLCHKEHRVNWF